MSLHGQPTHLPDRRFRAPDHHRLWTPRRAVPDGPKTWGAGSVAGASTAVGTHRRVGHSPVPGRDRGVTALATSFVQRIVEYDTTREGRLAFLQRVRGLATPEEHDRLARSPRAGLPWPVLRARAERTGVAVNGVSLESDTGDGLRVIVAATLTTRTAFASVTGFRRFTLTLVPADDRWRVDAAEGIDP